MNKSINHIIKIKNMFFSRGTHPVFNNINLKIPRGKITAIMGPSGIGKTTLLRLIGGQLRPEKGEIFFDGDNISILSRSDLYMVRKKMSMLFQSVALFTDINVFDNVAFPLREHTLLTRDIIHTVVMMKLETVGLRGAANLMPDELSGGMARRVALARAIALDPELILFDEPFVGQDPVTMGILVNLIYRLNYALGITCIIVSHDIHALFSITDKVYIFAEQCIIARGTVKELKSNKDEKVQQFLHGTANGPIKFQFPENKYLEDLLG
ncbi:MAG: phospholipid ABC transporter ATP-binding protein MlaF [Arsenophonus sp.]|nr:MAG: phospholipid ABC transporter ATP-binding protein MlaF [Arsenophonus sp.]